MAIAMAVLRPYGLASEEGWRLSLQLYTAHGVGVDSAGMLQAPLL